MESEKIKITEFYCWFCDRWIGIRESHDSCKKQMAVAYQKVAERIKVKQEAA